MLSLITSGRTRDLLPLILAVLFLFLILATSPAKAAIKNELIVTNGDDSGPGSLRQAIADAQNGDTILIDINAVAADNENELPVILLNSQLEVSKQLTIKAQVGQQGPIIIDIAPGQRPSRHLLNTGVLTLMDFTFRNGRAAAGALNTDGWGGAIINFGKLHLIEVTFEDNSAALGGGAIYNAAELSAEGLIASGNSVKDDSDQPAGFGGAVLNISPGQGIEASFTYLEGQMSGNQALGGGGIYNIALQGGRAVMNISGVHFQGQVADSGAAVGNEAAEGSDGQVHIERSSAAANEAGSGGVLSNGGPGAHSRVVNFTAYDNQASNAGSAIINAFGGQTEIYYSTFVDNGSTAATNIQSGIDEDPATIENDDPQHQGGRLKAAASILKGLGVKFKGPNIDTNFNLADDNSGFEHGENDNFILQTIDAEDPQPAGKFVKIIHMNGLWGSYIFIPEGQAECGDPVNVDARGVKRPQPFSDEDDVEDDDKFCLPGAVQPNSTSMLIKKEIPEELKPDTPIIFNFDYKLHVGQLEFVRKEFSLAPDEDRQYLVPASEYVEFDEQPEAGWVPEAITCTVDGMAVPAKISLIGEDNTYRFVVLRPQRTGSVNCTVHNTISNSLTIDKKSDFIGQDPFKFSIEGAPFPLNPIYMQKNKPRTFNLPAGEYVITEEANNQWTLDPPRCDGVEFERLPDGVKIVFKEGESQAATCHFFNTGNDYKYEYNIPAIFKKK